MSIACCLSNWALGQIDKRHRAFLWSGTPTSVGGRCKLAWPVVCRPTHLGGLGVLDLCFFGFALRLRWEWLSRTARDTCWARLPFRPEKSVAALAGISMTVTIGEGASARLWTDSWASVGEPCVTTPLTCMRPSRAGKILSAENLPIFPIYHFYPYVPIRKYLSFSYKFCLNLFKFT